MVLALKMRQRSTKNGLLLGVMFLGVFYSQSLKGVAAACDETFSSDEGTFTLTVSSGVSVCNANVVGPNNSVVLLGFSLPNAAEENTITLEISDQWSSNSTLLYKYTGGEVASPTTNLYSFSPNVLLALEGNGADYQLVVSYTIEDRSNLSTILSNGTGEIMVTGDSNDYINFQHTWHISAGEDNFLYFYIKNVTLDDEAGDFLAIGTGDDVFAEAPALMLTGTWLNYPTVHLNGTEGYVYLFMKSYSPDMGVFLFFNTWLYTPPTLFPPFTKPPLEVIDVYFYFDDDEDNYHNVVTNFTKYVEKYAYLYCEMETSTSDKDHLPDYPLVLDVEVAQVVETNPCLVVEFYVDILNGTCLKDISFSSDDFGWLLGNYSDQFNSDFGRDVMFSCPMQLLWILAVVIVIFVSVLIIVFVGFKSKEIDTESMLPDDDVPEDQQEGEDPESSTYDEASWLSQVQERQSQPNIYDVGVHDTYRYYDDIDSLEREKEAHEMGTTLNVGNYDETLSDREKMELKEMPPPMKTIDMLGSVNNPYLNTMAKSLNDLPSQGINNDGFSNDSDDELNDVDEMGIYQPVHHTFTPSTSNHKAF